MIMDYEKLLEMNLDLTERQKETLEVLVKYKTQKQAAYQLGVSVSTVEKKLRTIRTKAKLKSHINDFYIPEGYDVKGTSTYIDAEGNVLRQWVKTNKENENKLFLLRKALFEIVEEAEEVSEKIDYEDQESNISDQLAVYTIGDAHIGMYSWDKETGEDFDLNIAKNNLKKITKKLIKSTPKTETALIVDVGDFFHADNQLNETSASKAKLDVDTRWAKVIKSGLKTMVYLVQEVLKKHEKVIVKNAVGNHNEHTAMFIALYLDSYFRNEPRVTIDDSPNTFWYYKFGKNLIGVTHGHRVKPNQLGEIMSYDCADIWSDTKHRYWYTGHIHHDTVKEFRVCKVESFRTLAPKDAWHNSSGYRSGRDMKSIILDKKLGEVQRITCSIDSIK